MKRNDNDRIRQTAKRERAVKKAQSKYILLSVFLCALVLVSVCAMVTVLMRNTMDKSINVNLADSAINYTQIKPLSRDDADYSRYLIVYYNRDGDVIREFGNPYENIATKIPSARDRATDIEIGGVQHRYYLATVTNEEIIEEYGVLYVRLFKDITGEIKVYTQAINICYAVFAGLFVIFSVLTGFFSLVQVKPLADSLTRNNRLISDIAHELNTPLAIVNTNISNTLTKPDQTVATVSDNLAVALDEVSRMKKMVRDLLTLSRSDNMTMVIENKDCDLTPMLKDLAEPFELMSEMAEKSMVAVIEDGLRCYTDIDKVKQMVIALLDNALKYTEKGDSIELKATRSMSKIIIRVADTGKGVSPENISKIFQRFFREDSSRTSSTGGSGLGLAIVKTIALNLDANLYAMPNQPKGFAVEIELPIKKSR